MQRFWPFLTLILLVAGLAVGTDSFLRPDNLTSVVRQTAVINIIALGMTVIMVAGGIDLSVGSMMALSGMAGCLVMEAGGGAGSGIAAGVGMGLLLGTLNGLGVARLKVNPFIVTLGAMGIYRGLALISSSGLPVQNLPAGFSYLGEGRLLGAPFVLWVLVACAAMVHVLLERTRMGRYAFAIGSNPEAAYYAGVPVAFHTTAVYSVGGLMVGLAGMIESSRLMTGQPTAGQGYELQAIAAVVIGGGSLRGGEGSVVGTLTGAFIMGLLANGSDLLGISPYVQQATIGAVIVLAVYVDELRKRAQRPGRSAP
jgi:ribose transport system permease protein